MRDWFAGLESRERVFVSAGLAVVAAALLYGFAWMPLQNGKERLADSVSGWERSLAELRPLKGLQPAPSAGSRQQPVTTQQTPVVIVDQTLRARGLDGALQRSQPTTGNGIRVEFENVAFDELVLWLGDLEGQYAMQVAAGSFSVTSRGGPGRVNATLTLERSL